MSIFSRSVSALSFIENYHPDQIEFYATLGHAINQWAGVERALYELFWHLQGEPKSAACPAAYHAVINFKSRLSMADSAMAARYFRYPDQVSKWITIKNRLGRLARRRNDFAHLQLIIDTRKGGFEHKLRNHFFDPNPFIKNAMSEYTVPEIGEHAERFNEVRQSIDDLAEYLREARLPEFDEQEVDHLSQDSPNDLTSGVPQPLPQSSPE